MKKKIYLHGYTSSGKGFKGQFLKNIFPDILTPDFKGSINNRMEKLYGILEEADNWIIIGSSFGGLMGSLFAISHPKKVIKLILLAPYITSNDMNPRNLKNIPIKVPVIAFHGKKDDIVDLEIARSRAEKIFSNLSYNIVDDDHMLQKTMHEIKWKELIENV